MNPITPLSSHRKAAGKLPSTPPNNPCAPCAIRQQKDIVVVGWIDPDNVPLSSAGIDDQILTFFPLDGKVVGNAQKTLTLVYLGWLAGLGAIHPVWVRSLTRIERHYILHWMFKYAANTAPPGIFETSAALDVFVKKTTNYKLYNRVRVAYYVGGRGPAGVVRHEAYIGTTNEPLWGQEKAGAPEKDNGKLWMEGSKAHKLNKGNPESVAVAAFNTLASDIKLKWRFIASTIIQSLSDIQDGKVENENYPTYWIYERIYDEGADTPFKLKEKRPQAPSPEGHLVPV